MPLGLPSSFSQTWHLLHPPYLPPHLHPRLSPVGGLHSSSQLSCASHPCLSPLFVLPSSSSQAWHLLHHPLHLSHHLHPRLSSIFQRLSSSHPSLASPPRLSSLLGLLSSFSQPCHTLQPPGRSPHLHPRLRLSPLGGLPSSSQLSWACDPCRLFLFGLPSSFSQTWHPLHPPYLPPHLRPRLSPVGGLHSSSQLSCASHPCLSPLFVLPSSSSQAWHLLHHPLHLSHHLHPCLSSVFGPSSLSQPGHPLHPPHLRPYLFLFGGLPSSSSSHRCCFLSALWGLPWPSQQVHLLFPVHHFRHVLLLSQGCSVFLHLVVELPAPHNPNTGNPESSWSRSPAHLDWGRLQRFLWVPPVHLPAVFPQIPSLLLRLLHPLLPPLVLLLHLISLKVLSGPAMACIDGKRFNYQNLAWSCLS